MKLRDIIAAHPAMFYPQTWHEGEAFMDACPTPGIVGQPARSVPTPCPDFMSWPFHTAATLVQLYVQEPGNPVWLDYLWTRDTDKHGQRVYVGGVRNGQGFEIHRHLHITERWGVPLWQ